MQGCGSSGILSGCCEDACTRQKPGLPPFTAQGGWVASPVTASFISGYREKEVWVLFPEGKEMQL
jgi:hypothetical protein